MNISLWRRKRKNRFAYKNDNSLQAEYQLTRVHIADTMKSKEKTIYSINQEGILRRILLKKKKKKDERYSVDFSYLNIGYYIITPILMGVFVGLALDIWLGTRPLFVMIGILGGTVGIFYNLFTFLRHGEKSAHQHKT